ncbi:hypothetical protein BDZ94DRAFT_322334 [Collybia nuda]|uniref:Uncharacterized protein n=1 Tax=Collybia nuda TaxID=64659 RepID=A0A9P5YB79_9AGAR|nr:hypothetical protein BDZ94DRAFT_322334 [Collybia nuda]
MPDVFRHGLGYAVQWYDHLWTHLEKRMEASILSANAQVQRYNCLPDTAIPTASLLPPALSPTTTTDLSPPKGPFPPSKSSSGLTRGECARILVERCPACFGGAWFGRSFNRGGNIHVGPDSNFNPQHITSAGDCPTFYQPEYFLSKQQVDTVGERIEELRRRPPRRHQSRVPMEAIDGCKSSHTAGSGSKSKTNMDKFDDSGIMALVCRHDIPLFLANIDTPGEQQKYSIALIEHLFTLLPCQAMVGILYDIGCILDRSLQQYPILHNDILNRLTFATSAMHVYAHQWACQLVYNPQIQVGLGLTDGEGIE